MKKILFLALVLITSTLRLSAAELIKEYACYLLAQEPFLDGKMEENVWNTLPEADGFFILGKEYAVEKQTYFKAGWTKEVLYIAVKSDEPTPEKIAGKLLNEGPLWEEDSIELFFFPEKTDNYLQFIVNSIGSRWNGTGMGNTRKLWNWQAKASISKGYWSVEIKIPFAVLGRVPKEGERWRANVARNTLTGPEVERYTCWPPLKTGFQDLKKFGIFIFKENRLSSQEVSKIEEAVNFPYYLFLRKKSEAIAKQSSEYKDTIFQGLTNQTFQKEAASLKETWDLVERIAAQKAPTLKELVSAFKHYSNLIEKSKDYKSRVLMNGLFD